MGAVVAGDAKIRVSVRITRYNLFVFILMPSFKPTGNLEARAISLISSLNSKVSQWTNKTDQFKIYRSRFTS